MLCRKITKESGRHSEFSYSLHPIPIFTSPGNWESANNEIREVLENPKLWSESMFVNSLALVNGLAKVTRRREKFS